MCGGHFPCTAAMNRHPLLVLPLKQYRNRTRNYKNNNLLENTLKTQYFFCNTIAR